MAAAPSSSVTAPVFVGAGAELSRELTSLETLASRFAHNEAEQIAGWADRLADMRATGPVALWGAGAKGVTLANLVDPNAALIDCVVDVNPNKQQKYLPGSGHPIVSVHDLPARGVRGAVVMNPNYLPEITEFTVTANVPLTLSTA